MLWTGGAVCLLLLIVGVGSLWRLAHLEARFSQEEEQKARSAMVPQYLTNSINMKLKLIPAGKFLMGSPPSQSESDASQPQHEVTITKPFYFGLYEVTQEQFERVMGKNPSKFRGNDNPVENVYWSDANEFCRKLSELPDEKAAGRVYRLPTEAEWEYAARAGSKTAYGFGEDPEKLDEYAWYFDNSGLEAPKVGTKKPDDFGLYDMHGCVAELTVNQYTEDGYAQFDNGEPVRAVDMVVWPEWAYPIVVRGGSWEMDAEQLRSAARLASDDEAWKDEDPNFPTSPWWFTSDPSRGVGFRLFRSFKPLSDDKIVNFWEPTAEDVKEDVKSRMDGGRGGMGLVDQTLPEAISKMKK